MGVKGIRRAGHRLASRPRPRLPVAPSRPAPTISRDEVEAEVAQMQRLARLGSWRWDLRSNRMQCSPTLLELIGLDPAGAVADADALLDADSRQRLDALMASPIAGSQPFAIELTILSPGGQARRLLVRGEVSGREGGRVVALRGTALDVTDHGQAELSLRQSEARFRAIFNSMLQFIGVLAPDGRVVEVNETALAFGGLKLDDVVGVLAWDTYWWNGRPEIRERLQWAVERAARGELVRYDAEIRGLGDQYITIDFSIKPVFDADGAVTMLIPEGRDVTEERRSSIALAESENRFRQAMRNAPIGEALVSPDGRFLVVNEALCTMLGYSASALRVLKFSDLTHPDDVDADLAKVGELLSGHRHRYRMFKRYVRADGAIVDAQLDVTLLRDAAGNPLHFISQIQDITQRKALEEQQRALNRRLTAAFEQIADSNRRLELRIGEVTRLQEQLRAQAVHDGLTGLYNRRYFDEALAREMITAAVSGHALSLIIADLDDFKSLNDQYGHQCGDAMLQAWAEFMRQETSEGDILCRYGGEEFALVLPQCSLRDAGMLAERLRLRLSQLTLSTTSGRRYSATVSMGVACMAAGDSDASALIRSADTALYEAKASGRDRVICHRPAATVEGLRTIHPDCSDAANPPAAFTH